MIPTTSADFDRAYRAPVTFWGDFRIPSEIKELARGKRTSLELGCGLGRFSRYVAKQGVRATAVDFSAVAIERAKAAGGGPDFVVGDVTRLDMLTGPYDVSFDVGCFHCLRDESQSRYVAEIDRLLAPNGTHLIWALDSAPADIQLSPDAMRKAFGPQFVLKAAKSSRRRVVASHWYWLMRAPG